MDRCFVEDVGKKGGLHRGLIFDQVGGTKKETVEMGGQSVEVYQGGIGIGQYAIDWFKTKKKPLSGFLDWLNHALLI